MIVGANQVETLARHFEEHLGAARRTENSLSSERAALLYSAVDALRKLVHEAVTGEDSGLDVGTVVARLSEGESTDTT